MYPSVQKGNHLYMKWQRDKKSKKQIGIYISGVDKVDKKANVPNFDYTAYQKCLLFNTLSFFSYRNKNKYRYVCFLSTIGYKIHRIFKSVNACQRLSNASFLMQVTDMMQLVSCQQRQS